MRLRCSALALSCLLALAGSATSVQPAQAALTTGNGNWFWRNPLPQGNNVTGVSCPSAQRCLAVAGGGTILKSDDGGASWRTVPSGTGQDLLSISCPTTLVCVVGGAGNIGVAGTVLVTDDTGETWTLVSNAPYDDFRSLSCPTIFVCYAIGSPSNSMHPPPTYAFVTTDGGASWVNVGVPFGPLEALSCPAVNVCYSPDLFGTILKTADGWNSWTILDPGLASGTFMQSISCPSAATCYVDGAFQTPLPGIPQRHHAAPSARTALDTTSVRVTNDGGTTWVRRDTGSGADLLGVSCASLSACYAVGRHGTVMKTLDGGVSWTGQSSHTTVDLYIASCSQPAACVAAAGITLTATSDGSTWSATGRGSVVPLHAVSCATAAACVAVGDGGNALVSSDAGVTWSPHSTATTQPLRGVSCPSASVCFAVGDGGVVETSADGGTSWTLQTSHTTNPLRAVSCPTLTGCLAVGYADAVTTTDGATWTDTPHNPFDLNAYGVSCFNLTSCFEVGDTGKIVQASINPFSETPVTSPTTSLLSAVACPSATSCFAAGWQQVVVATTGGAWVAQPVPLIYQRLYGIACSSTTTCVAVGVSGTIVSTHDGSSWSRESSGTGYDLDGAACFTSCLAVGDAGTILASAAAPEPPVDATAIAGDGSADLFWDESLTGALPVTSYSLTATRNGVAQPPIPIAGTPPPTAVRISGLTDGDSYTFALSATNGSGSSALSAASNAVVPGRGRFHTLPPARILDTRYGQGAPPAPVGEEGSLEVQVTGQGGVPSSGVAAVVLNVTVTNTTASSYLTVWPAGVPQPLASNLNWTAGRTVPNLVEVAVGRDGRVAVFNARGSVDVIFDVAGYVATPTTSPGADGVFTPVVPNRVLDTRNGTGGVPAQRLGPNQTISVRVAGTSSIPTSGVAAVVLNVTVTGATASSFLTVFPTGTTAPLASNLNFVAGQTVPNRVIVKLGVNAAAAAGSTNGWVSVYNPKGSVQVIADVGGWYSDGTDPAVTGSRFVGLSPARILDTRYGTGGFSHVGAGQTIAVPVAGQGGVPAMSDPTRPSAVVLNVTVTATTAPSFLTVWPTDAATRPLASDLNWVAGLTVPNLVVVKLGADGKVDLYNLAGTTDVVIDVVGWYG